MRLLEATDSEKLRGGFYTPAAVVDECLARLDELRPISSIATLLEPSAGDGAFVAGLAKWRDSGGVCVTAVELVAREAAKCRRTLEEAQFDGVVEDDSFFAWVERAGKEGFDGLVGNPPFVRYQFVDQADRRAAERILRQYGSGLAGVSNLWIGFVLVSLRLLKPGGAFALVLPAELLSTVSGAQVRDLLVSEFEDVRLDLYPRSTFPDILQDVMVVSGRRAESRADGAQVQFVEHSGTLHSSWTHFVRPDGQSWTRLLLTADELAVLSASRCLKGFRPLGSIARIQVSIVTGANAFFTVPASVIDEFEMEAWSLPLLARSEDALGIVYRDADYCKASSAGKRSALLHFGPDKPDPLDHEGARAYLSAGKGSLIHERYKCRIRDPWYRVPHVRKGSLLLSKRAHQHHRLLLNDVGVFTTDTIYRGQMLPTAEGREADLVAGFHNSATLLSCEVEGRTYGGGVLELVPSEITRLNVPLIDLRSSLAGLDLASRSAGGQRDASDSLVEATDLRLSTESGEYAEVADALGGAWRRLRQRRLTRK